MSTSGRINGGQKKKANGKIHRVLDARPDNMDFRDQMFIPTLVSVPTQMALDDYLSHGVPVLDQGQEGACTGFGLSTVANYLLRGRLNGSGNFSPVSPRMFYTMARRYDEWPGEEYSGSSARGAMKGWNKHGVCTEAEWPYHFTGDNQDGGLTEARMKAARRHPLGAYFRVNHKDIVAMHSALAEVGILYATAMVHEGWNSVRADGIVPQSDVITGGHAFAIVGYTEMGFWIQNSWGPDWGKGGMCLVSYDDWLANGTDVWVARLGAPIELHDPASFAIAHAASSGRSDAYTFAQLRPHIVNLGREGRLQAGGDYGTTPEDLRRTFEKDLPALIKDGKIQHLLLFAPGGLTTEKDAVQRIAEYRTALLAAGVYPIAFFWHSDYWSTLKNVLGEAFRRTRPEGLLDNAKDFMLDRVDDMLEPIARTLTGKLLWNEMKENALAASNAKGGASLVAEHIGKLKNEFGDNLGIHIVGHSAGSILHAPLVQLLASDGEIASGPAAGRAGMNIPIDSCTLWAPACTLKLFEETYKPLIETEKIKRFTLFTLSKKAELDDNCVHLYNKSVLYLISHAFEAEQRIPLFSEGEPLLGMARWIEDHSSWKDLLKLNHVDWVVAPNNDPKGSPNASNSQHHEDFDNDLNTVLATLQRIVGGEKTIQKKSQRSFRARSGISKMPGAQLKFEATAGSMSALRQELDRQSLPR